MSRCLPEKKLVWLQAGEGGPDQERHLAGCPRCAARFGQLRDDLALIGRVLEGRRPATRGRHHASPRRAWLPAVVAFVLVTVVNGLFAWYGSREPVVPEPVPRSTWRPVTNVDELLLPSNPALGYGESAWLLEDLESLPLADLES